MNWTTEGAYLTFLRGYSIQEGDLFKRVVISRAYGMYTLKQKRQCYQRKVTKPIDLKTVLIFIDKRLCTAF